MLKVSDLEAGYRGFNVLHQISFQVGQGEIISLLGSNGAGKSTTLRVLSGLLPARGGRIEFLGRDITNLSPHEIVRAGIVHVPEGRLIFGKLSVLQNLMLGAYTLSDPDVINHNLELVFDLFPILGERKDDRAENFSGGQQQMLAFGRGLMASPKLLLLDEPSLGLMPKLVDEVFESILRIKAQGITIILVEQRVREALDLCDRGYVLQSGNIVLSGTGQELLQTDMVKKVYLGL
ncbi:MAG: ABC transporter ATP-binding protein [Limnochordia bacterium]|jgi:branched-chain amino acid transport system ATP-binding protein